MISFSEIYKKSNCITISEDEQCTHYQKLDLRPLTNKDFVSKSLLIVPSGELTKLFLAYKLRYAKYEMKIIVDLLNLL